MFYDERLPAKRWNNWWVNDVFDLMFFKIFAEFDHFLVNYYDQAHGAFSKRAIDIWNNIEEYRRYLITTM